MVTTQGEGDGASLRQSEAPSSAELTDGINRLTAEVDSVLSTDRWAILDSGREHAAWLLYDAASLRHCCQLLREIEVAAQSAQELTVRVLGRTHLEAWLVAVYLHFGGYEALTRIAQDSRYQLEMLNQEARQFDTWLATTKKATKKRVEKVKAANEGIAHWNVENPDKPAKALHDEPYVPQLSKTGVDLSAQISELDPQGSQPLPISEIVDTLTKLGPEKGFGRESFRAIYVLYRVLSSVAPHPTLNVYDSYFEQPHKPGGFIRVASMPAGNSLADATRITALYSTAFLAGYVLGDAGCNTPVANELRDRLEPDPNGSAAWSPGV